MKILVVTDDSNLRNVLEFSLDGWGHEAFFFDRETAEDIKNVSRLAPDIIVIDVGQAEEERLEICDELKNDFATSYIPVITLINKRHLRQQLLDLTQGVDDYLIKPPDPLDLKVRIEMAVKRSQHSFYANPLTGLPGGIVVEDTLKAKLKGKEPFVMGHVDIDNFKSFNDKYGYLKGDRIIMQTAYMLNTAVRSAGNSGDLVAHIGGDDFVIVTTPDKYNRICENFICMFDTIAPFHYSRDDRQNGYIVSKGRTNRIRNIPIMSVTIALVLKNSWEELNTIIELNERIAEVKQYLKKMPGSKYMADRRMLKKDDSLQVQLFANDKTVTESYKPLGQILLDNDMIKADELDKALKVHWKRGIPLGEVLRERGSISDDRLEDALGMQEHNLEAHIKV